MKVTIFSYDSRECGIATQGNDGMYKKSAIANVKSKVQVVCSLFALAIEAPIMIALMSQTRRTIGQLTQA